MWRADSVTIAIAITTFGAFNETNSHLVTQPTSHHTDHCYLHKLQNNIASANLFSYRKQYRHVKRAIKLENMQLSVSFKAGLPANFDVENKYYWFPAHFVKYSVFLAVKR